MYKGVKLGREEAARRGEKRFAGRLQVSEKRAWEERDSEERGEEVGGGDGR